MAEKWVGEKAGRSDASQAVLSVVLQVAKMAFHWAYGKVFWREMRWVVGSVEKLVSPLVDSMVDCAAAK